jgi:hypothetical protein
MVGVLHSPAARGQGTGYGGQVAALAAKYWPLASREHSFTFTRM